MRFNGLDFYRFFEIGQKMVFLKLMKLVVGLAGGDIDPGIIHSISCSLHS